MHYLRLSIVDRYVTPVQLKKYLPDISWSWLPPLLLQANPSRCDEPDDLFDPFVIATKKQIEQFRKTVE